MSLDCPLFVLDRRGLRREIGVCGKLEEAGYVEVDKGFAGKKPRTMLRLTGAGRKAVDDYRTTMRAALKKPRTG